MKREKTINAETDINQTGGMHLPSLSLPSQTVRCIYLIFEMFQVKRKDSFQSLAGLISPPAAAQGMKSGTLKLFKVDIGWRIKSLNQSPIFRVRAERIKHHLGQKFVNLWWGPRRIKRRENQFVLLYY